MKKFKSCCLSCILVAVLITVSVTAYGVELPPPYETEGQAVFSVSNPVTVLLMYQVSLKIYMDLNWCFPMMKIFLHINHIV